MNSATIVFARTLVFRCIAGLWLMQAGCGSNQPYPVAVSGSVTLDGKPLSEGVISFITLGQPPEPIEIRGGTLQGKAKWGVRRIEIAAYRPYQIPADIPASMHALMKDGKENYLPERYHSQSTLVAEVKRAGPNVFTYEIHTQPETPTPP